VEKQEEWRKLCKQLHAIVDNNSYIQEVGIAEDVKLNFTVIVAANMLSRFSINWIKGGIGSYWAHYLDTDNVIDDELFDSLIHSGSRWRKALMETAMFGDIWFDNDLEEDAKYWTILQESEYDKNKETIDEYVKSDDVDVYMLADNGGAWGLYADDGLTQILKMMCTDNTYVDR